MPTRSRIALIGGRRTAHETQGDPNGAPLLILRGAWGGPAGTLWSGPRLRWRAPLDGIRLILYDRRNNGASAYSEEPFDLADLARDAIDLLDHLRIPETAIAAASAGGPIALRIALDYPDRVQRIALLGTGAALMHPDPPFLPKPRSAFVEDRLATIRQRLAMLDIAATEGSAIAVAATEMEWRSPPAPPASDPELDQYRTNRSAALAKIPTNELTRLAAGAMRNMQTQVHQDLTNELHQIKCPAWILHSQDDTTVPREYGQALADAILHSNLTILPGAAHALIDDPAVQRAITAWARNAAVAWLG